MIARVPLLALVVAGVALVAAGAVAQPRQKPQGEWVCEPLIRAAEQAEGIPQGLLLAIGRAESGVDTSWGRLVWPWALNIAGKSVFAPTRDEALRQASESLSEIGRAHV